MSRQLHYPTAKLSPTRCTRRAPSKSLDGKVVALFDIGKTRGDECLDSLEALLKQRGIATARYPTPTNVKTAPVEILQRVATEADVVVAALSD